METKLSDMLKEKSEKMLYVYDFMNMKIFYVELMAIVSPMPETDYPRVVLAVGHPPKEDSLDLDPDVKMFMDEDFDDEYNSDDDPEFISTDDLDDY